MNRYIHRAKKTIGEYVDVIRDTTPRQRAVGALLLASTVPATYFPLQADIAQKAGIGSTLTAEAKNKIDNFSHIVSGVGGIPVFRSTNIATITLEDGSTCVVEYRTDGGSLKTLGFSDHATLTNFGTCPPKKDK
jgi:hypothetical protein